jgi:rhamnose utilization protein RhaD (predicted bifunctional aldolase and dehydrogenase)
MTRVRAKSRAVIPDLWDEAHAAGLDEPGLLLYRSNLLGSDLRVADFGGGGASAKFDAAARLSGEAVKALWAKGSASKSTGNIINVDAGNAVSFTR